MNKRSQLCANFCSLLTRSRRSEGNEEPRCLAIDHALSIDLIALVGYTGHKPRMKLLVQRLIDAKFNDPNKKLLKF